MKPLDIPVYGFIVERSPKDNEHHQTITTCAGCNPSRVLAAYNDVLQKCLEAGNIVHMATSGAVLLHIDLDDPAEAERAAVVNLMLAEVRNGFDGQMFPGGRGIDHPFAHLFHLTEISK